jgi:hypothetical protein
MPAFAIFYLVVEQDLMSLFAVAIILIVLAIWELVQQEFGGEALLSKIIQAIGVVAFFPFALLALVGHVSANLAAALKDQSLLTAILWTRMGIAIVVATVVLLQIGIETFRHFEFRYREIWPFPKRSKKPRWSGYPFLEPFRVVGKVVATMIIGSGNLFYTFIVNVGMFFALIISETLSFLWRTFFGRPLWEVLFRVTATAACLFILVIDIVFIRPHIVRVMREPSIILLHDSALALSNLFIALAFIVAIIAIIGIVWTRIPRGTSSSAISIARQIAARRVIYSGIVVYICCCGATLTCFPVLNYFVGINESRNNFPGVYTTLALILGVIFTTTEWHERDDKDGN